MKQREQATSWYQLASPHATSIPHELIPLGPPRSRWPASPPAVQPSPLRCYVRSILAPRPMNIQRWSMARRMPPFWKRKEPPRRFSCWRFLPVNLIAQPPKIGSRKPWARDMKDLLLDMKQAVQQARGAGKHELDVLALGRFHRRYDCLIHQGYAANPPPPAPKKVHGGRTKQNPARNLLDQFSSNTWQVLAFVTDFAAPFDTNQAERDLRMIKVQQKISECFRTEQGVTVFCRIRSYLSTLRKQGENLLLALEHTLSGHPFLPAL